MDTTHATIVNYFESIGANLKDLNSFFRMDLAEIQGSFRSNKATPSLVVESHDGNLEDSSVMQTVNKKMFAFTIYMLPTRGDFDDQNEKLDQSERIGLKIIARMKHDATLEGHFLYGKFKHQNVTYAKVGPVFNEALYGYRFVGTLDIKDPLVVNPEDWEDSPLICS